MRVLAFLFLALAACAPTKRLPDGPVTYQSSVVSEQHGDTLVMARVMAMGSTDYVVYFSVALPTQDIEYAYAFDTPMPYVAETGSSGFITMSQDIFQKLSKTGFDVVLVGGTEVYPINVPGSAFQEALGFEAAS
ncbi:MAG: hypothetical protein HKN27_11300 [Silicimonas sp.]|nr:hypothetical protein [Silicimonas sp.]